MARPRTNSAEAVLEKATKLFWRNGFAATSMADLVGETGSTKHSIYADFASKDGLYRACFDWYREKIVAPALEPFRAKEPQLEAVSQYFEIQIRLAEETGLPGPGCLVGNAMTETAPKDTQIAELVRDHNLRLEAAFGKALPDGLGPNETARLTSFLVLAAQGLWAMSRVTSSAAALREQAKMAVDLIEMELKHGK